MLLYDYMYPNEKIVFDRKPIWRNFYYFFFRFLCIAWPHPVGTQIKRTISNDRQRSHEYVMIGMNLCSIENYVNYTTVFVIYF